MNEQSKLKYFDLHTTGLGYLHRAREVTPPHGEPFLAVVIAALHGNAENVEYTHFDCRVSGREAQTTIRALMPLIEDERKVLVGFRISDLFAEPFTYERGEKQGQTGVSLKARVLKISWARVDGTPFVLDAQGSTSAVDDAASA